MLTTLLMTDIVGSTVRAAGLGDAGWSDLLARHNEAVRRELDRSRGIEVKTTGDGFLARFDGAARAVTAAQAIRDHTRRLGLEVRAGIHTGEVEQVGTDLRGLAVHEVARIAAAAGAGEILVSEITRALLGTAAIRLVERGRFDLKGIDGPRTLYAVQ